MPSYIGPRIVASARERRCLLNFGFSLEQNDMKNSITSKNRNTFVVAVSTIICMHDALNP